MYAAAFGAKGITIHLCDEQSDRCLIVSSQCVFPWYSLVQSEFTSGYPGCEHNRLVFLFGSAFLPAAR